VRPIRRGRLAPAAVAVAICAALVVALSAGSAAAERRVAAPCTTSNLVIWIPNGKGSGAAGSVYYKVEMTNSGSSTCTLKGFPKVTALDLKGRTLGQPAARESGGGGKTITLAPEASTAFNVRITEAGNYTPSECHPVNASGLSITPPGQSSNRIVPLPFKACAQLAAATISITAVGRT
jgi:hypothetical protein